MRKKTEKKAFSVFLMPGKSVVRKDLEDVISRIVSGLKVWGERRAEFTEIPFSFGETEHPDLLMGVPKALGNPEAGLSSVSKAVDTVVILPGENAAWDRDLAAVLKNPSLNVLAIVRANRILGSNGTTDPEEWLMLEEVIKDSVRKWLRRSGLKKEEDISKAVNWKASLSEDAGEQGYTSLFADPSTRRMAREVKEAILTLKDDAKAVEESRKPVPLSVSADGRKEVFSCMEGRENWPSEKRRIPAILLLGESGTGKTLLARWIGSALLPGEGTFTRVNISAMQKSLIDGELFGAVQGAYTDLTHDTPGLFLSNVGKTVFLDEIGDMDSACQTRLLTFLDDGLVSPMGWHGKPFSAPLIIVAATNRPVREWIASGNPSFREDLFYRFDCVISLPPLRERRKDMRLLVSLSLQEEEVNPGYLEGNGIRRISLDAIEALEKMDFPGNFRELRIKLKRACSAARREGGTTLSLRHLFYE